ncbi:hypothetical protein [Nodosilinea nodulosa]|nr:hypothetical protein [Nodosilinea nodulosa]
MLLTVHSPNAKEIAIEASQMMQRVSDRLTAAQLKTLIHEYAI